MVKKIFLKASLLTISLSLFSVLSIAQENRSKADFEAGKNLEIFFNIYKNVAVSYVDTVNYSSMIKRAADAMLGSLDPYTNYMTKDEMAEFNVGTTGKYGGVGSLIRKDTDTEYIRISEPWKGSPADKAGLRPGDLILAIDGESLKGVKVDSTSAKMKGVPGTSFIMSVRPGRGGADRDIKITRERIKISPIPYSGFIDKPNGVGYIALDNFSEGCTAEVRLKLEELQATGNLKSLILDLRDNGGGLLDEAISMVGLFTKKGTEVVSTKGRTSTESKTYRTSSEPITTELPLIVLVNNGTASSSEIVAGALQDLDRAVVYGTRTFGKGLVQSTMNVGYGSYIKVTIAKYYIPSGRCIQAVDYSHRNEDGSVGHIPDSLTNEFTTRSGRKVYDGGGITPDIKIVPEYINKFLYSLVSYGYIDDYAVDFYKANNIEVDPISFSLTDNQYQQFCDYLQNKKLDYITYTKLNLDKLKESAKKEEYAEDIAPLIEQIEKKVAVDKNRDLVQYKDKVKQYLESAIVANYCYGEGRSQRVVMQDKDIKKAADILIDKDKFNQILSVK